MPTNPSTTKRSPRAAKPKAVPVSAPESEVPDLNDFEPVIITDKPESEVPTTKIFELDGKDYRIPAKPTSAQVMSYFINVRKHGLDTAIAMMLGDYLGEDALHDLAESRKVDNEDMTKIFAIVTKIFLGQVRAVSGN